jgi:LmbE family N-acetylglucosaminyl deacetylase
MKSAIGNRVGRSRRTLVCFHAHPDDESLLTGGTIARAAAAGSRVVVVVATLGEAGLADRGYRTGLGDRRRRELATASAILGVQRTVWLGYADSGMAGAPSGAADAFADADPGQAAERLAAVLREERCDVLTVYDAAGGYGHPDHIQVHRVGVRAAGLAGTPVVLEATVDRDALLRVTRLLDRVPVLRSRWERPSLEGAFTPRALLTHQVDVRPQLRAKRMAMAAHASQATADAGARSLAMFLRLPGPLFARVFGREWFVERGRPVGQPRSDDVFGSLGVAGRIG